MTMMTLTMTLTMFSMTAHHEEDLVLYLPFLFGQLIYIVKRAGFSMRAGRATSRWGYVYQNWDIILFRSALEFCLIFMPIRHFAPAQMLSFLHIDVSGFSWGADLATPVSSPAATLFAGIGADGAFDWLIDWASRSPKVPPVVKNWLTENVTPLAAKS